MLLLRVMHDSSHRTSPFFCFVLYKLYVKCTKQTLHSMQCRVVRCAALPDITLQFGQVCCDKVQKACILTQHAAAHSYAICRSDGNPGADCFHSWEIGNSVRRWQSATNGSSTTAGMGGRGVAYHHNNCRVQLGWPFVFFGLLFSNWLQTCCCTVLQLSFMQQHWIT